MSWSYAGPMLVELAATEGMEDRLLSYAELREAAMDVGQIAAELPDPLLCPLGEGGQRLAGAVEILTNGAFGCAGWRTEVRDRVVLILSTVGVSAIAVERSAAQLRAAGAKEVHAWAADRRLATPVVDAFHLLKSGPGHTRRSA